MGKSAKCLLLLLLCLHLRCTECRLLQAERHSFVQKFSIQSQRVSSQPNDYPFRNVSLSWAERVKDLVSRLTLEHVQAQMGRGGAGTHGGPAPAIPSLGIDPYQWNTECLRGDGLAPGRGATAYPQAIGLAAAFHPNLIFRVAEAAGVEVRGKHNDFVKQGVYDDHTGLSCFSPVINIMRDPRWGRNQETYGEDPFLTAVYAENYVRGLQGNNSRYIRANAGCKHFDAYAGPENVPTSRLSFDAQLTERDWRMTFLPAFRSCVKAGTYSLMCSYNSINGIPACAHKQLLTDILRTQWNFTGYVVSDEGAIELIITDHKYLNNSVDTVAACVNAGCNLELSPDLQTPVYVSLLEAIKQGKLTEETVRERVTPLFYTRMRLGEFDPPEMNPYSTLSNSDVETPAHEELAIEAAMKSFVLLKNNGILPLKQSFHTIGVVGPFANNTKEIMGDYSPNPSPGMVRTALWGLQNMGYGVQFAPGCANSITNCIILDEAAVQKAVFGTDVNFVLVGTGNSIESEGTDRNDLGFPGLQKQLVLDVLEYAPKTPLILVLFSAGPLNVSFADADDRVAAIIQCFFPAQALGPALSNVLRKYSPAGRSPYTWPMWDSQLRPMVNYSMEGRTYRYFDGEPLYPFGYGLSYTRFAYRGLSVPSQVVAGSDLVGQVTVSNLGDMDSDEVVQVYISWVDKSLPAPQRQLAWFDRVFIPSGSSVNLTFTVAARSMALWLDDGWNISGGAMMVYVGGQQPDQKKRVSSDVLHQLFVIKGSTPLPP